MTQEKVLTTGVSGGVATRLEINQFIKDNRQLSLYVQALSAMFKEMSDSRTSWFSVGGIHGMPYVSWNDSPVPIIGGEPGPYCTHGTNIFPTWHRPYVALVEQIIHGHAVKISEKYTVDANLWKSAAENLRQPYWDWAINPVLPDIIIADDKVQILSYPHGQPVQVDNPFFQYKFGKGETDTFLDIFKIWQQTLRHPKAKSPDARSDIQDLKNTLKSLNEGKQTMKYDTFRIFCIKDWDHFSTTDVGDGRNTNSLEGIHNTIHLKVGGVGTEERRVTGHMSENEYAGFDVIFYLHHCQVDRLLSLWSHIHGVWVPEPDTDKDLTPFWNTQTTYWKSADISKDKTLNYTYPELIGDPSPSQVAEIVRKLYAGPTFEPGPIRPTISLYPSQETNSITEWSARIRIKQFEIGGSFLVLIFLGDVPQKPNEWLTSPTLVGTFDAFVNRTPEVCENCQSRADSEILGFVYLNSALTKLEDDKASLHPDYVVPRLKKDLAWRVLRVNGTVVQLHEVPSLEVVVIATPLTLTPGAILPTAEQSEDYHHITRGSPGGSRAT